ncbi:hypothetical protein [Caballeronia sp. LjRoot31]|uniref:hypothetical protein n=1 Tax=Caballeronia sp. LjRoot31 TaxID=3342324 RepID=UPI003ECC3774
MKNLKPGRYPMTFAEEQDADAAAQTRAAQQVAAIFNCVSAVRNLDDLRGHVAAGILDDPVLTKLVLASVDGAIAGVRKTVGTVAEAYQRGDAANT